jgi:putative transposase
MPIKAYKYRIYPNKTVAAKLEWTLDRCRELYNASLDERSSAYRVTRKIPIEFCGNVAVLNEAKPDGLSIGCYQQINDLPEIKESRPEYKEIGAHVLCNVIKRVDRAMAGFFSRIKKGQTPGYPRFKGKYRYNSFTYPDTKGLKLNGKVLTLPKIGMVNVKLHRPIEGTIKTATIKREGEHWYVVFACEAEACLHLPYTDEAIGIDLGVLHLATLSTGDTIENPKHYRRASKKLATLQQALSRKKRGSHRRKKAARQVAKHYRKIASQRRDYLHKQSRQLVNTYATIVFEDIKPAHLVKAPKPKQDEQGKYLPNGATAKAGLNKSIQDTGWSQLITMCESKAECAGSVLVIRVDPKYTSQVCSGCGTIKKKELSERWHSCECGCELDRDHNAAINILRLGLQQAMGGTRPTLARA